MIFHLDFRTVVADVLLGVWVVLLVMAFRFHMKASSEVSNAESQAGNESPLSRST
ncbi:MAG: hypothetical protein ACQSGP_02275 [Frankia sp.]